MKFNSLVICALLTALVGCAKPAESGSAPPLPSVYNQIEYQIDLQNLIDLESQLRASGHKFLFTEDNRIHWDDVYANQFVQIHRHKITNQQRIDALEIFQARAEAFLNKYKGSFNLRDAKGFSTTTRLEANLERMVKQKNHLAKITASALKSNPIKPEPEFVF